MAKKLEIVELRYNKIQLKTCLFMLTCYNKKTLIITINRGDNLDRE